MAGFDPDPWADKRTPWRDAEKMRELYIDEGMSGAEIAEELECTEQTAYRWLHKHGIEMRHERNEVTPPSDDSGIDWSRVREQFDLDADPDERGGEA